MRLVNRGVSLFCLSAILCSPALGDEPAKAAQKFVDGEAQIVPEFKKASDWIRHHLWVETEFDSDGDGRKDRMHVDVTRPGQTETEGLKVHVIYESSPYYSGTAVNESRYFWDPRQALETQQKAHELPPAIEFQKDQGQISDSHIEDWVPRGFAVLHSSSPGTGRSQGCPTVGGDNESLAPKAVIDWLNGRAKGFTTPDGTEEVVATWATGSVGMTGTSYNGTIPLAAATTGVDGLKAIIPVAPNTSYYHYYRSNGLIRHPGGYMGEDIDVLYNFIHSGNPAVRKYCNCEVRDKELLRHHDRVTGDYNDFWAGRDYLNDLGPMKAALLMSHAFNDWNVMPEHSVRIYQAVKAKGIPTQVYFHQGGHGGPPPLRMMNRWFTRYVCGIENGVENDARSWIVREGHDRAKPDSYGDYPHPESAMVELKPVQGGHQTGKLVTSSETQGGQGLERIVDNFSFTGATLAKADWTEHRLLFSSPELTQDLHVSGTAKIRIRLSCNRPTANLSVWLVSLPWTDSRRITDDVITRGWADPQNAESISASKPLKPGEFRDVEFELQPDDQVIALGERIGLMIFSTDRDFTLLPDPGAELTVDLDQTTLWLPVVGGAEVYNKATSPAQRQPAPAGQ